MSENTNECVIEWIPGRDYVGLTAKNGSSWKNRCEELEKEFPEDVKIIARNNDGSIFAHLPYSYIKINPPRKYSDEAKKKAAERLNKMREEKSNTAAIGDGFSDCHRTSGNIKSIPFDGIQTRKEETWEAN